MNCLHTALVTLGIEQFDLLDMQDWEFHDLLQKAQDQTPLRPKLLQKKTLYSVVLRHFILQREVVRATLGCKAILARVLLCFC